MASELPLGGVGGGKYDAALMGILQDCVKLPVFLDAIFSFLARRTDFYILMKPGDKTAKMGFVEKESESNVKDAFRKYELLTRTREAELMRKMETKRLETPPPSKAPQPTPKENPPAPSKVPQPTPKENPPTPSEAPELTPKENPRTPSDPIQDELPISMPSALTDTYVAATQPPPKAEPSITVKTISADFVSDTYNGGVRDDYKWSQTLNDLDIRVPIPLGSKSKDVKVVIKSDHLKVEQLRPHKKVLLNSNLLHRVKVEDCVWTIDNSKRCLTINLEKTREIMWKSVFEGEEGIDLTKVDTTKDISEFDPETQAAIQRASYDNRMKLMGKPTSQEKKAHDILKKAWDVEGSPFKGTPFDPSRVQISGDWS